MRDEDQRNAKGTKDYTTKEVHVRKGLKMKEQKAAGIQRFIPSSWSGGFHYHTFFVGLVGLKALSQHQINLTT